MTECNHDNYQLNYDAVQQVGNHDNYVSCFGTSHIEESFVEFTKGRAVGLYCGVVCDKIRNVK